MTDIDSQDLGAGPATGALPLERPHGHPFIPIAALAALLCSLVLATPAQAEDPLDVRLRHATDFAQQQLDRTAAAIPARAYPQRTGPTGSWLTTRAGEWTSGFLPGSFWLAHQLSAGPGFRVHAQSWQAGVESQKRNTSTHDLGFMLLESFGNGHRLTATPAYRDVVLQAAASLASRYDPIVGAVRSWNTPVDFRVIVDNMMNLELLMWGARNGGLAAWRDMAISHALKTRAHHVRADGSTYHVVDFDEATGAVTQKLTRQGAFAESSWARGSSWAMHGFTMMYRETGDGRFLDAARLTSDFFLANLPADRVPYWDFEAPNIPDEPRDSSAAAIAAAALVQLSGLEPDEVRRERYRDEADAILSSLTGPGYLAEGTGNAAVLLHGTYSRPANDFDHGVAWGDYYLLQALLRRQLLPPRDAIIPIAAARASSGDGSAAAAFDGDLSTGWSAVGDGQWLELDLGTERTVAKVTLAYEAGDQRASRFDVQTSADGIEWTTRRSAVSSATTLQPEAFDFADTSARYVRIVGHGTSVDAASAITEVTVRSGDAPDTDAPPAPTAVPAPGTYVGPIDVSLTAEPGAVIRYTADGSEPTATSPVYSAPLPILASTTITAVAVDGAGNRSAIASLPYVIEGESPAPGGEPPPAPGPTDSPVPAATVIRAPGRPPVVMTPPARPGQREVGRRETRSVVRSALRRLYSTRFEKRTRYRVRCRRKASTRWACRVSWRHRRGRFSGTVVVRLRPGIGYSTTVRVRDARR